MFNFSGSHGDGSISETETPIVLWGAGISGPKRLKSTNLTSPPNWELDNLLRIDMNQADLVPLMSILVGIPIPVHSLVSSKVVFVFCGFLIFNRVASFSGKVF